MRRSVFLLCLLMFTIITPVGVLAQDVAPTPVAAQELAPEEYITEGDPTPPPQLQVQEPELVVVPSGDTQVYMVPNTVGVYFYGGRWYRHHHGVWFGADAYDAPWASVELALVPSFVVDISPAYALYLPPSYPRIHYHEFDSNWRTWDRERHWDRYDWYRNERRDDIRRDRMNRANERMTIDRRERDVRVKADPIGYKNRLADPTKYNKPGPVTPVKPGPVTPPVKPGPVTPPVKPGPVTPPVKPGPVTPSVKPGPVGSQKSSQQQVQPKSQAQQPKQQTQQPKSQAQQPKQQTQQPKQQPKQQSGPQQKSHE